MSILPLISAIEAGSTDLESCLSSLPELSLDEKLELLLADQRFRITNGREADVGYYVSQFEWLKQGRAARYRLVIGEYQQRMLTNPQHDFFRLFVSQITELDDSLFDQLLHADIQQRQSGQRAIDWDTYREWFPDRREKIDCFQNQYASPHATGVTDQIEDFSLPTQRISQLEQRDLEGSYISGQAVGDLRGGRYRLQHKLGQGAFGAVYLAQDTELQRQVAVKIPRPDVLAKLGNVNTYLAEARNVAALDHPHIVAVYDVGRTADGVLYVVSKYINGGSLAEWYKAASPDFRIIVDCLAKLAEALHHAHQKRLIHRDIKPANILIEEASGTPYLADFGLSIREEDYLQEGHVAGTPAYMSPEQIRGEGHRLDGRSDLFSLGVVMYQVLTGRLPFAGQTYDEIANQITTVEPPAPRALRIDIPTELERICLKLLRKRASERYSNGRELAEDLRAWLIPRTSLTTEKAPERIIPRGLRSFTADDAGFFLELLPGPRNREGLPESIAFWKTRIEQRDPEQTFAVGLLYGPSGCGKSSLVQAGLIPNLAPDVIAIYVEATPEETEIRLLRQLSKRLPELPSDLSLAESVERIRRSDGPKVVLIIDQFEQWLYSHRVELDGEMVGALRQCDGGRLQAILMIRDDFYLAAVRLMNHIDVPIATDQNFKLVDLFDIGHAKRVLIRFGEAYERLPMNESDRTPENDAFVNQVVEGLSEGNKVVSVRLSLLADMLKGRNWVPETIVSIGGLEGIGISFLEETFASSRADARHRAHQIAVRRVLRALLPESGTDIRRAMRAEDELLEVSGYANRRQDFQDLLRILDGELRLLTPTDPESHDSLSTDDAPPRRCYQLTHDYLISSLREWLTRKQRETKKGRAELKLAERTAAWNLKQESKQLPTLGEWFRIRFWTDKKRWSTSEKAVMRAATHWYLQTLGRGVLTLTIASLILAYVFQQQNLDNQRNQIRVALDSLPRALGPAMPDYIREIKRHREDWVEPELRSRFLNAREPEKKLAFGFALAAYGKVEAAYLVSEVDNIANTDLANLISALKADRETALREIRKAADQCKTSEHWRRKVKLGLLALAMADTVLAVEVCEFKERTDHTLRTMFLDEFSRWPFDLTQLLSTVSISDSPALRSAVCLGLGVIPKDQFSDEENRFVSNLLKEWYPLPDSSTHSAVMWLQRQWGLTELPLDDANLINAGRDWFVNIQGATMVRIVPPSELPRSLPDPRDVARQWLENNEFPSDRDLADQNFLSLQIHNLFNVGAYEETLKALDSPRLILSESQKELSKSLGVSSQEAAWLRVICYARLQRAEEAELHLRDLHSRYPSVEPDPFLASLVPLWLGKREEASTRLREFVNELESSERFRRTFGA